LRNETRIQKMMSPDKPKVVVISGPTGIGKTAAAIRAAETFNGEIISADSMQIFRYMDIGTAKPTREEQARVRHYMIDIADPDEAFDALKFAEIAREKIGKLHERNILPVVAGGTGFYIRALLHGLFDALPVDTHIRTRLKQEAEEKGLDFLYCRLQQCDPYSAEKIHPNDRYRILRGLEVYETTGKTISEYQRGHGFADEPFNALKIGICTDRAVLYERINRRVEAMIAEGLIEEVKNLLNMGYSSSLNSMQSIGYRHIAEILEKSVPIDEAVATMKQDTRRYAKRQMTWFRADPQVIWTEPGDIESLFARIREFLTAKTML
jgi:tRNA dimethylallyltransferase